ncbi:MAG: cache domain-containing protein [Phycisphaerae bacterium]
MKLRDLPIRYKLMLSYSLLFMLIFSASSTAAYLYVRDQIRENIASELRTSSEGILNMVKISADLSIRNSLRADAESARDVVRHLYLQFIAGEVTEQEARRRAEEFLLNQRIGSTGYVYCINSRGVAVVHPRPSVVGTDYSDLKFIQKQIELREGYIEYDWKNPGETKLRPKALYMVYFEPWDWIISASSYREEFIELVKVHDFRETIHHVRFGDTGYPYIFDSDGEAVLHPTLTGNFKDEKDVDGRPFVREMIERRNGMIFYRWQTPTDERPRMKLAVFRYIPEFDWIVASSSYADEFYAPLDKLRSLFLGTLVIALLLTGLISWKLSDHIASPLRTLTTRFRTGAAGDLSSRVEVRSRDEVGALAKYFNSFMARLEEYRKSLETEIKERKRAESEREALEEQMRQKMKMEAIGQLAGGVAHDFNNILTAIRGNAELLRMGIEEGSDESDLVGQIVQASDRAADLTAQLLAFGRKGKLQVTRFDLHDSVHETVRLLRHTLDKRIDLRLDLQAEESIIEGDSTQIQNALLNLAINARDAMPDGGRLLFVSRNVPFDPSPDASGSSPGRAIELSITDTGVGIPQELHERVFEPFFTTKAVGEGSGLGLAGVYGSVENHNGRIQMESTPGKGTTFRILLPVVEQDKDARSDSLDDGDSGVHGSGTILVVEDEQIVRKYVARMLERFGYRVILCEDGLKGLTCFRKRRHEIDAVILDLTMPHMSGATALKRMLQIDRSIPIILASGYNGDDGVSHLMRTGAAGFVPKPYTPAALTRELKRVLDGGHAPSRARAVKDREA